MQSVYLDNAATTPLTEEVIEVMYRNMTDTYGNPSSSHALGRKAKSMVEKTRKNIAKYFNCKPSQVIFTAGGSEADNLVLFNAARNLGVERFISSKIEHHAVTHCLDTLEKEDQLDVDYVGVNRFGEIDYAHLEELLSNSEKKTLVSLMLVNNEIGNILDLDKVISLCQKHKALFHSDTVQGIGHVLIDLKKTPIDFMAASAHKFHGPKGVGFCIVKNGLPIKPLLHGGEQEMGSRAGTENTISIAGMDQALKLAIENFETDHKYVLGLKTYFIEQLRKEIKDIAFNGLSEKPDGSAFHILNVRFPIESPMLLFHLDLAGIAASGGSACQSGSNKGSHVLSEILSEEHSKLTSVRFSFSKYNTKEELDYTLSQIKRLIKK